MMDKVDEAKLLAVELLHVPYIWGGDDPLTDGGLDCSGFIGYIFRKLEMLPVGYDRTAQGYYDLWKRLPSNFRHVGCVIFYGKRITKITHTMMVFNPKVCVGAVRGNKYIDTPRKALLRNARVDVRPINYRRDIVAIVDPFKEV